MLEGEEEIQERGGPSVWQKWLMVKRKVCSALRSKAVVDTGLISLSSTELQLGLEDTNESQ